MLQRIRAALATPLGVNALILWVSVLLLTGYNRTYFAHFFADYPLGSGHLLHSVALVLATLALIALPLALVDLLAFGRAAKPLAVVLLLVSSVTAYFMDSYDVVISEDMLHNAVVTNPAEVRDLLTLKWLVYVLALGVLPAWLVARQPLRRAGLRTEFVARLKFIALLLLVLAIAIGSSSSFFASFLREHKQVRRYANPGYWINSAAVSVHDALRAGGDQTVEEVGRDARKVTGRRARDLFILVVGETARADHFSVNGYARDTTPELARSGAISFGNFWACGTSTAFSVPCMFYAQGMNAYSPSSAGKQENLLDILQHAGVNVLWLDNNSDSHGVAERVPYMSFRSPETNSVCDTECRDVGMLVDLQQRIDSFPSGDIVIVLHQMGNHGPAYFKRYPLSFEKFTPACQSNDLSQCAQQDIINAYDNAIAYTDHFLARVIELLKKNDSRFETAMLYASDHGESLGEMGVYLHGLPRSMAPEAQLHVPAVLWLGQGVKRVSAQAIAARSNERLSHDSIFHTVLGFLEIDTSVYQPKLDILALDPKRIRGH